MCPFGDLTMHKDNTPKAHMDIYRKIWNMADDFRKKRMMSEPRLKKMVAKEEARIAKNKQRLIDN